MFEKYTEGAVKVIMLAQEESRRMGHNYVGTEQLLLGVVGQRHGIGCKSLEKVGVTLRKLRRELHRIVGRGSGYIAAEIPFTPRAKRVLEMAVSEGKDINQNYVGTEHLLLALVSERKGVALRTLLQMRIDIELLRSIIYKHIGRMQEKMLRPVTKSERYLRARQQNSNNNITRTPTLEEYSDNITNEAIAGKLDPVIGRDSEVNDLVSVLARRRKNNPVLLGEPGVGKTAVAELLAQRILEESLPDFLDGCVVFALDLGSILAGTKYRGEFEERIKRVVEEAEDDSRVIVVIDEIHTLVGAGAAEGAVDAANILKPALARGKFRCVGATTKDEYRKYIERDPALERRFQPIDVEEPSVEVTVQILKGLKTRFEKHHKVKYEPEAIRQAAALADQYIADRFLPDKAIDVIDEAGARVRLKIRRIPKAIRGVQAEVEKATDVKEKWIDAEDYLQAYEAYKHEADLRTNVRIMKQAQAVREKTNIKIEEIDLVQENDVATVVSNWTGIPVNKISGSESDRLLKMEEILHERIIGQKQAVTAVSNAIRRSRVGLRNPNRPIASFIFAGPTGVGKTELTKAVAEYMFTDESSMIRLDMSEYMEKHTVAKLIGSPPGYVGYNEGGQLTEAVHAKPYCVVLFDEVEKAHPDVFNLLLQILDDGRLTDSRGKVIDFTNALIVMTTNLGSKVIEKESGIKPKEERENAGLILTVNDNIYGNWEPEREEEKTLEIIRKVNKLVKNELKNFFRPEFLNRIDEIIVFNHLTKHDIWEISEIMINQLVRLLKDKGLNLFVTEPVRALLVEEGHDPLYGARPLRRTIMHYLEDQLAERCLSVELKPNTKIIVRRKTFEQYKNEVTTEQLNEMLKDAIVVQRSEERKMVVPDRFYSDVTDTELIYENPFGVSDKQTLTKDVVIEIDTSLVEPEFRELPGLINPEDIK